MPNLKINEAPLLPNLTGIERIPTGGRGDFTTSVDQFSTHVLGKVKDAPIPPNQEGAVSRAVQQKLFDSVSVKDFGAKGDGTTDDLAAFLAAAAAGVWYVPQGVYYLSSTQAINIAAFYGQGQVLHLGKRFALTLPAADNGLPLANRELCTLQLGYIGDNAPFAPIFTGAERTPQGIAICETPAGTRIFLMQRTGTGSSIADEETRIVEMTYREDGGNAELISYSQTLLIGHQTIDAIYEDGKVWIYSSAHPTLGQVQTANVGKGYCKFEWKGHDTSQSDVISYQLFGDTNSQHPLAAYRNASICVSEDGKYVCLAGGDRKEQIIDDAPSPNDDVNIFFAFDRKAVESATNPLTVQPTIRVQMKSNPQVWTHYNQGFRFDGKNIYIVRGYFAPLHHAVMQVFAIDGSLRNRTLLPLGRGKYGWGELMGTDAFGSLTSTPVSFEPEGLAIYKNQVVILATDFWRNNSQVVSFAGKNYATRVAISSAGRPPYEAQNWVRTERPTTHGEYNSDTVYNTPTNYSRRNKVLYAVKLFEGLDDEWYCCDKDSLRSSGATLVASTNAVDVALLEKQAYQINTYFQQLEAYRRAFAIGAATDGIGTRLRLYPEGYSDTATINRFMQIFMLDALTESGRNCYTGIRGDRSKAQGAWIDLYSTEHTAGGNASQLRMGNGSGDTLVLNTAGVLRHDGFRPITFGTEVLFRMGDFFGRNLSITPPSSNDPKINGELRFEATSDTQVTVKLMGSDGVVRSTTLNLV